MALQNFLYSFLNQYLIKFCKSNMQYDKNLISPDFNTYYIHTCNLSIIKHAFCRNIKKTLPIFSYPNVSMY